MRPALGVLGVLGALGVLASSGALVSAAVVAVPAADAAPGDCFGLAPTVVAAPGAPVVTGTEGDDVIVTSGVERVEALGGDDAICATGARWIDAGDGDDRVRHHASRTSWVVLGSGSDLFEGSSARDIVHADRFDGEDAYPGEGPTDHDVVRTYGGDDRVTSVEAADVVSRDEVVLGAGDDRVTVQAARPGGERVLRGGTGDDTLQLATSGTAGPGHVVDLAAGTAAYGDDQYAAVGSFDGLVARSWPAGLTVRGTDGADRISVTGAATIDAGAGRDRITVHGHLRSVRGGPGVDTVEVLGYGDLEDHPVRYDLARRTFTRGGTAVPFATERLTVWSTGALREDVVVRGTPGRDVVTMRACGGTVHGAAGDDVLRSAAEQCEGTPVTLRGGPGDDRLRGGSERDVLLGGAGRDRADGREGVDRCRAETELRCERD